jgi:hypothetical protein
VPVDLIYHKRLSGRVGPFVIYPFIFALVTLDSLDERRKLGMDVAREHGTMKESRGRS